MQSNHVVVWLDHSEAHIIAFNRDEVEKAVIIRAAERHEHQHHRADSVGSGKAAEHPEYYEAITQRIRNVPYWLIVGPANAKLAFSKYVHRKHGDLVDNLVGIETVDHPTDAQLLAHARKYFVAADRMAGVQTPS